MKQNILSVLEKLILAKKRKSSKLSGSIKLRHKRGVIFLSRPSKLSLIFSALAAIAIGISILSVSVPIVPAIWYAIKPDTSRALAKILSRPGVTFGDLLAVSGEKEMENYQPPLNPSLPSKNLLRIAKIGVETEILENQAQDYEQALEKGVWRVPDFGTPFARRFPTILVAHRFGYLSWSNSFRKQNSFYNLPKLSPGDKVEIIWKQRKYVFEIYGGEESEEVTDYTADLILYTCRFLESDVRIFRYAKLVKE